MLPRMILVDTVDGRRNKIASAFRNAGCHVTEASTPLEAIAHLGGSRFELGLIAIADTVPETVAEQLREFLLDEHPWSRSGDRRRTGTRRELGCARRTFSAICSPVRPVYWTTCSRGSRGSRGARGSGKTPAMSPMMLTSSEPAGTTTLLLFCRDRSTVISRRSSCALPVK
jgi:hypothetical protein